MPTVHHSFGLCESALSSGLLKLQPTQRRPSCLQCIRLFDLQETFAFVNTLVATMLHASTLTCLVVVVSHIACACTLLSLQLYVAHSQLCIFVICLAMLNAEEG